MNQFNPNETMTYTSGGVRIDESRAETSRWAQAKAELIRRTRAFLKLPQSGDKPIDPPAVQRAAERVEEL